MCRTDTARADTAPQDADGAAHSRTASGRSAAGRPGDRRGQTTIDFALGISIFLVALSFIVVFVPGMLQPFVGGAQADTPAANRVVDDLSQRLLGNASEPYVLDGDCTREFFTSGAPAACQFDGGTLQERVGVVDRANVNVTVRGNATGDAGEATLCWNDAGEGFVEQDDASCSPGAGGDVLLSRGPDPTVQGGKTVSARRVALLDGQDVTIEVVMW